jgi:hypothetical protein
MTTTPIIHIVCQSDLKIVGNELLKHISNKSQFNIISMDDLNNEKLRTFKKNDLVLLFWTDAYEEVSKLSKMMKKHKLTILSAIVRREIDNSYLILKEALKISETKVIDFTMDRLFLYRCVAYLLGLRNFLNDGEFHNLNSFNNFSAHFEIIPTNEISMIKNLDINMKNLIMLQGDFTTKSLENVASFLTLKLCSHPESKLISYQNLYYYDQLCVVRFSMS